MKLILVLLIIVPFSSIAQTKINLSGYVYDGKTGEILIGATIRENSNSAGTTTNDYGFFSLSLEPGKHLIICSFVGYKQFSLNLDLQSNTIKTIRLTENSVQLGEVVVIPEKSEKFLRSNEFHSENLSIKDIRKLPIIFGEADVIKAVQLQAGVKTLGDGSSGMFIRGGSSDQNLIIIDEAPIYNPSHMFGLISVFNADAINNVNLIKSNMPAQYGGRVSAVIDCKLKEGNLYKYNYCISLNPFAASVFANGPIVKEKSAFLLSFRKSVVDLIFSPQINSMLQIVPSFYDMNLKLNTKLGNKNRIYYSLYYGKDRLRSTEGFDNVWSNICSTIRWNLNLSSSFFSNVSVIYSNYSNNLEYSDNLSYNWQTGVKDYNAKLDFTWYLSNNNSLKFGINSIYHQFVPGETKDTLQSIPRIQAYEHGIYLLNDLQLRKWVGLNAGLRISFFQNTGKATWFDYNSNYEPIDIHNNLSGIYNTYVNFEPRLSANFKIDKNRSLKIGYARNAQFMQVLQNSSLSYTSLETWFPANTNIKPITADVFSIGWFQTAFSNFLLSMEIYYKNIENRIDYIDHAQLLDNQYVEAQTRNGKEKAYGLEIVISKEIGLLTGNVSYCYSRVLRTIPDINNNNEYSAPFDIPHDVRIFGNYKLNDSWSLSALWMFTSGRPATIPTGFYYEDWVQIPIYPERNSTRFPNYHRLDIAAMHTTKPKNKKYYWDFGFGFYNLYNRINPIGYKFTSFDNMLIIKEYSLFKIMPNVSVKLTF